MKKAWIIFAMLMGSACSGGGGDRPDAGVCPIAPFSMPWPSEADPQVCSRTVADLPDVVRTLCGDIKQECANDGVTEPVLDCLTTPINLPADPASVTLWGYADVFSNGPDADKLRIEVYRESDLASAVNDPGEVTPLATTDVVLDATTVMAARACPKDINDPIDLHGECIQPDDPATCGNQPGCDHSVLAVEFCHATVCSPLQRWEIRYEIPNMPTNEFLVMRTIGLTAGVPDNANETWAPLVQYNVFLATNRRACLDLEDNNCLDMGQNPPRYQLNANLFSRSDFDTVPVTAGLPSGVQSGHGAVAGEIHDCTDVRLQNVQIGYRPLPLKATYFNGNPAKTLPELGRGSLGTNLMGIWAGLDIAPGSIQVEAIGNVNGQATSLGGFTARVWPDTVSAFDINGGTPQQP